MSNDPYATGMIVAPPKVRRLPLGACFVGVLDSRRDGRGLALISARTRCIRRFEVHELIVTDDVDAGPGRRVDRCAYLGFVEFQTAGVLVEGDEVRIGNRTIGRLAGFDETHFPNHYNLVLKVERLVTGMELDQKPGDALTFLPPDG